MFFFWLCSCAFLAFGAALQARPRPLGYTDLIFVPVSRMRWWIYLYVYARKEFVMWMVNEHVWKCIHDSMDSCTSKTVCSCTCVRLLCVCWLITCAKVLGGPTEMGSGVFGMPRPDEAYTGQPWRCPGLANNRPHRSVPGVFKTASQVQAAYTHAHVLPQLLFPMHIHIHDTYAHVFIPMRVLHIYIYIYIYI